MHFALDGLEGLDQRFLDKIEVNAKTECWEWTACKNTKGYGSFGVSKKTVLAHRYAYEHIVGPIPNGLELDHHRLNPGEGSARCSRSCVNPGHLEAVTHSENVKRGRSGEYQRIKTHCSKGHEFTEDNTYLRPTGGRQCMECQRQSKRDRYVPSDRLPKTHCPQGHEYSALNTSVQKNGAKRCRQCSHDAYIRRRDG